MIKLRCPKCHTVSTAPQNQEFASCQSCGQRMKIPGRQKIRIPGPVTHAVRSEDTVSRKNRKKRESKPIRTAKGHGGVNPFPLCTTGVLAICLISVPIVDNTPMIIVPPTFMLWCLFAVCALALHGLAISKASSISASKGMLSTIARPGTVLNVINTVGIICVLIIAAQVSSQIVRTAEKQQQNMIRAIEQLNAAQQELKKWGVD